MQLLQEELVYDGTGGPFEGLVCRRSDEAGPRPGIMVAHTYGGQSQFEADKAALLAELGYVGFAIDLYGQGRRASSPDEAGALMAELDGDRPLLARRMNEALAVMKEMPQVDPGRTAAIGFCFGGKCVLDLARSGADIRAVVSFHGLYDAPPGMVREPIKAAVLALHGWDDPLAPPDSAVELARELTERGTDWQVHAYGHTGHSFTNPRAQAHDQGMAFQPRSSARAWSSMSTFLREILGG